MQKEGLSKLDPDQRAWLQIEYIKHRTHAQIQTLSTYNSLHHCHLATMPSVRGNAHRRNQLDNGTGRNVLRLGNIHDR